MHYDRIAEKADQIISAAPWFFGSLVGVIAWIAFLPLAGFMNPKYHLWLNSPTTAATFVIVGVSANAAARQARATNAKLNEMAALVADIADEMDSGVDSDLRDKAAKLRQTIGMEEPE